MRYAAPSFFRARQTALCLALLAAGNAHAAITTTFSGGVLTVTSDAGDAVLVECGSAIPRAPSDNVLVNGLTVPGFALCSQVTSMVINGGPLANTINLGNMLTTDFTALTGTTIDGGAQVDTITGSFAADVVRGGTGNDSITLGGGDDTNTWNNGDGTDVVLGGAGTDRQVVNGASSGDIFTIAAGTAPVVVRFDRTTLVPFGIDLTEVESLDVNGLDGDDSISAEGMAAGLIALRLSGGLGVDTLVGSSGIDVIDGGDGNDTVDANPGNDSIVLGIGDDTNTWNNGDNTDAVQGGDGTDRQIVNGAGAGDVFTVAVGTAPVEVRFDRTNLVPFGIDLTDVESLDMNGGDGNDQISAEGFPSGLIRLSLNGGLADDTLIGSSGADALNGGDGNDTVDGNPGNDSITLGIGNDTNTWNNGDSTDTVSGDGGTDTQIVNGASAGDQFEIRNSGGSTRGVPNALFRRTNLVPFDILLSDVDNLVVNGLDGVDVFSTEGIAGLSQSLDGGTPATFPGDTLEVLGFAGDLSTTPVVTLAGSAPIAHVNFEFAPVVAGIPRSIPTLDRLGLILLALAMMGLTARSLIRR